MGESSGLVEVVSPPVRRRGRPALAVAPALVIAAVAAWWVFGADRAPEPDLVPLPSIDQQAVAFDVALLRVGWLQSIEYNQCLKEHGLLAWAEPSWSDMAGVRAAVDYLDIEPVPRQLESWTADEVLRTRMNYRQCAHIAEDVRVVEGDPQAELELARQDQAFLDALAYEAWDLQFPEEAFGRAVIENNAMYREPVADVAAAKVRLDEAVAIAQDASGWVELGRLSELGAVTVYGADSEQEMLAISYMEAVVPTDLAFAYEVVQCESEALLVSVGARTSRAPFEWRYDTDLSRAVVDALKESWCTAA